MSPSNGNWSFGQQDEEYLYCENCLCSIIITQSNAQTYSHIIAPSAFSRWHILLGCIMIHFINIVSLLKIKFFPQLPHQMQYQVLDRVVDQLEINMSILYWIGSNITVNTCFISSHLLSFTFILNIIF